MKLKKLEIHGFKSFVDKSTIHFPLGISAVVGPNGCGKSNILDALRWVMGEQSVKQLRGKSMEDIIFAGASGKPPLNMAEVNLTLINDNGSAPEEWRDYSEIMITRRLFRSGESAYLINKQPCRLKDIFNIFLGSGLGARSYAIIQQGNIGAITDAGPEERRFFIEEAAGVTRFKQRRTETLRKLASTQQNLYRLNDIIAEIKRQMAGLKRQARKAEIYKSFQERIKALDIRLAIHHYDDFSVRIDETMGLLQRLKDADVAQSTEMKALDAAVEEIKLKRFQKNQEIGAQKTRQFDLRRTVDKLETDLDHMKRDVERLAVEARALEEAREELAGKNEKISGEILDVSRQKEAYESEIKGVRHQLEKERSDSEEVAGRHAALNRRLEQEKNRLMELVAREAKYANIHQNAQNNKDSLRRRLKRIDEETLQAAGKVTECAKAEKQCEEALTVLKREAGQLDGRIADLKNRISEKGSALAAQVKETHTLEIERGKMRSQFQALKKMEASLDWYRDGVKAVLKTSGKPGGGLTGILGLMADMVTPRPGFEAAVEAALGESLQYVLVEDPEAGLRAMAFLQSSSAGRAGFIPVSAVNPLSPPNDAHLPRDCTRLMDHLTVVPDFREAAEALLGHVIVAPSAEAAVGIHHLNGARRTVVTVEGDVVTHQGFLSGGGKDKLSGILEKKQEIRTLEQTLTNLDRQTEAARRRQEELEKEARQLEIQLQHLVEEKNALGQDVMDAERRLYRAAEDSKNARRHLEIVQLEQEQIQGEESDIEEEIGRCHALLDQVSSEVKSAQDGVSDLSSRIQGLSNDMQTRQQTVNDIRLRLTTLNARLENSVSTLRRLKDFQEDGVRRLQELVQEVAAKRERRRNLTRKVEEDAATLAQRYLELKQLDEILEENETEYQAIDDRLKDNDSVMADLQARREKTLEQLRTLELEVSELRLKRENITGRIQERYHGSVIQFKAELERDGDELDLTVDALSAELDRCRRKISAIQDVNLGAIKEYEQLKTRYDFLCTQRDDLNQAIEDLHTVIRKINRITQERFLTTLGQVNEKLAEVFPRLFQGGSASLVMTDPSSPLETGIEFMIHPPGKKLTRMSLLSGGEKALSAIAFIFSIFLIRPTSFCLLDEIDAPLDDANVGRFNELLKSIGEKSQIIMVTHNKRSMEFADTLFGITMEKKGISKVVSVNLEKAA
ncbi:MAG: chromosome segregation protein SMC [Desulfobacterales bacterium]